MPTSLLSAALCLALAVAGCTSRDGAQDAAPVAPDSTATPQAAVEALDRPPAPSPFVGGPTTDTLTVDGPLETVQVRAIRETAFPLPFEARVPAPMAYETVSSEDGAEARFKTGEMPDGSLLAVFVLPEATAEAEARAAARRAAEAQGTASEDVASPDVLSVPGALASYSTRSGDRSGAVWLGRHAGRFFYVLQSVAGDGREAFAARRAYVIRRWRWLDDGSGLTGS